MCVSMIKTCYLLNFSNVKKKKIRKSHVEVAGVQLHLLLQLCEQLIVKGLQLQHTYKQ